MSVAGKMLSEKSGNRKVDFTKKSKKEEKNSNNKIQRVKQKKKKRLIIRNLSFKVDETELKKVFSEFGNVVEVKIPLKKDGKKRGFGFVDFDNMKSLIQAMKSMNYKEIKGRKVAIDFAVDKTTYQLKVQSMKQENKVSVKEKPGVDTTKIKSEVVSEDETGSEDEEEEDEDEKRLNSFLKEFDSGADALTKSKSIKQDSASDDSSDESSSNESEDDEENSVADKKQKRKFNGFQDSSSPKKPKKESDDISEGKTVFIRNVAFTSTEDSLKEALEKYGECVYCLLCMDQFTDYPKGTAFIKFKEKSSATKLVEDSINEPGVILDGRKLSCSIAISREELTHLGDASKKPKDKRNLNLLRVGLIMANSKESEGVSPADMARRAQLEITKKMKLKNVNFFVSDTRLMIHNLPREYTDVQLRKLFKNAAGQGAIITEAKVMKEFKRLDTEGKPVNKGFGFVTFLKPEDALTVLNKLNNNPDIFTSQKRPIVEFSVENTMAIQTKERKLEKAKMRNKRRTEEKRERQLKAEAEKNIQMDVPVKKKKQKNKQIKADPDSEQKSDKLIDNQVTKADENGSKSPKKKRKRKNKQNKADEKSLDSEQKSDELIDNQITKDSNAFLKGLVTMALKTPKKKKQRKSNKERREKKMKNMKASQAGVSDLVTEYKNKLQNKIT